MNQKDEIRNRCRNRGFFKLGSPLNAIRINVGNSDAHERLKFEECLRLAKQGHAFLTEAEFKGGRADIVDLDAGEIVEVAVSEGEESLALKTGFYPLPVRVIAEMLWR